MMEFENDISRSSDSDFNSSPKRVKRRLFASQIASKKVAIEAEKPVSESRLKSVRVHFAPGTKGRSFPLEYSLKFHLNCNAAGTRYATKRRVPPMPCLRDSRAIVTRPIKRASSKKGTAAA